MKLKRKNLFILFGFVLICVIINNIYYGKEESPKAAIDDIAITDEREIIKELKNAYNNDEIVGYLRIPNTDLKVPVTQSTDNDKYLHVDAYGNKDEKGNPFLDYRVDINSSKKLLIFGHNAKRYEAPFKVLENYYDENFYKDHKYIELITDENIFRYKIFSVYIETGDWSYMKLDYDNWSRELEKYKLKSFYDTGEIAAPEDDILLMQTCSTNEKYSKYSKKYLLIISRRVENK